MGVVRLNAKVTTYRDGQIVGDARWEAYARVLDAGDEFTTSGHLKGQPGAPGAFGRLDVRWHAEVREADYAVYSYQTPIAWRIPGEGWVIPARGTLGYGAESNTTVTGMNKIRTACQSLGGYRETPRG